MPQQLVTREEFRTAIGNLARRITGTPASSGGGSSSAPTGTGFRHVSGGAEDAAAKLVEAADVAAAAGIQESKLALSYATHSPANDPTTGQKAALVGTSGTPADGNRFVTNQDSRMTDSRTPTAHNHAGTEITSGTIDGDRLPALSTTKRGGVPATGTPSGRFLKDDGTWDSPAGASVVGYALNLLAANLSSTTDGARYYFGGLAGLAPQTTEGLHRVYIPKSGNIRRIIVYWRAGTAGTTGSITANVRINAGADNEIASVNSSAAQKVFDSGAISLAVTAGDYIEINLVCPTWTTNPATVALGGVVYIE